MKTHVVIIPYTETSRLFHASKSKIQESYLTKNGTVSYTETQAERFTKEDALSRAMKISGAYVKEMANRLFDYTIIRDGAEVISFKKQPSDLCVIEWFIRNTSQSMSWNRKHNGYSIDVHDSETGGKIIY